MSEIERQTIDGQKMNDEKSVVDEVYINEWPPTSSERRLHMINDIFGASKTPFSS